MAPTQLANGQIYYVTRPGSTAFDNVQSASDHQPFNQVEPLGIYKTEHLHVIGCCFPYVDTQHHGMYSSWHIRRSESTAAPFSFLITDYMYVVTVHRSLISDANEVNSFESNGEEKLNVIKFDRLVLLPIKKKKMVVTGSGILYTYKLTKRESKW
jgi:hypothetical protein